MAARPCGSPARRARAGQAGRLVASDARQGPLVEIDRVNERTDDGRHLWYSGKHKTQRANIQILADPDGFPVWSSEVEPGSTHDITAARAHFLGAL